MDLSQQRKHLELYDGYREQLIIAGRKMMAMAKKCTFAIHKRSNPDISGLQKEFDNYRIIVAQHKDLTAEGSFSETCQEYVETIVFAQITSGKKISTPKDLQVSDLHYVLGVCDVSGEIVRYIVQEVIDNNFDRIKELRQVVADMYDQLLSFPQRVSLLRKKVDMVRWNMQKIDDILYECTLKGKL